MKAALALTTPRRGQRVRAAARGARGGGRAAHGLVGEAFPPAALSSWGVKGKTAALYGADGALSSREAAAFDAAGLGATVVGATRAA